MIEKKVRNNIKTSRYTYYILCRKCKKVNVPDPPGLCSSCLRNSGNVRDCYRPKPTTDRKTKIDIGKCGTLPWVYRLRKEDHEMCHLTWGKYFISVQRQEDRKFRYIVGTKEESAMVKNITDLTYARTRSVKHLARIMGISFQELCQQIKEGGKK